MVTRVSGAGQHVRSWPSEPALMQWWQWWELASSVQWGNLCCVWSGNREEDRGHISHAVVALAVPVELGFQAAGSSM